MIGRETEKEKGDLLTNDAHHLRICAASSRCFLLLLRHPKEGILHHHLPSTALHHHLLLLLLLGLKKESEARLKRIAAVMYSEGVHSSDLKYSRPPSPKRAPSPPKSYTRPVSPPYRRPLESNYGPGGSGYGPGGKAAIDQ